MSRSKRNWDFLIDSKGNYNPNLKGSGGGGQKGAAGQKGDKGAIGAPGSISIDGSINVPGPPSQPCSNAGEGIIDDNGDIWVCDGNGNWINSGPIQGPGGPDGDKGEPGNKGESGQDGAAVDKGDLGPKGETGDKGDQGDEGDKGSGGDKGEIGNQGNPGFGVNIIGEITPGEDPNNDPSYVCDADGNALVDPSDSTVWICDGNGLWINAGSLQGPKGETGAGGQQGAQGPAGIGIEIIGSITGDPNLVPGAPVCDTSGNALLDENGDIWICDGNGNWVNSGPTQGPQGPDGESGLQGPKGEEGYQGLKGEEGDQGVAGIGIDIIGSIPGAGPPTEVCDTSGNAYLDVNGDIWICDGNGNWVNSGPTQGPKGQGGGQGEKGDLGAKGEEGDGGEKGDRGSQGTIGLKGPGGEKGEEGDQGIKGELPLISTLPPLP